MTFNKLGIHVGWAAALSAAASKLVPLLRAVQMSIEKLFLEVELLLKRELTPEERKFLILSNKVLKQGHWQETDTKAARASNAVAS